jgi:hypothetical protein
LRTFTTKMALNPLDGIHQGTLGEVVLIVQLEVVGHDFSHVVQLPVQLLDWAYNESTLKWSMKQRGSIIILLLFPPYKERSGIAIKLRSMNALWTHLPQSLNKSWSTPSFSSARLTLHTK